MRVHFPKSPRVIYERNPLESVVCQLRFARVLRIEAELPFTFQERFKSQYPSLKETQNFRLPAEIARALNADPMLTAQRSFEFTDAEDSWRISLSSDFVSLQTRNYVRWEDFNRRLQPVLDALGELYEVKTFTRVGLRYRDLIWRADVGFAIDTPWTRLIRSELLGELAVPEIADAARQATRTVVLALDEPDAAVRLSHELVERDVNDDQIEDGYLIDADFYRDAEGDRTDAEKYLKVFNQESGRLFRWCITDELHAALEPRDP